MTTALPVPKGYHPKAAAGHRRKQALILSFISAYLARHGYPPSVRDITRDCGISSTSVTDYALHGLERRGLIKRDPKVSRGLRLTGKKED